MKRVKVGINGMGRIGRTLLRASLDHPDCGVEVVAVNNPGVPSTNIHLLKYDSVHGRWQKQLDMADDEKSFTVDGSSIAFHTETAPENIPWSDSGIEVVIDATGKFKDRESLSRHRKGSVQKVIMCAPGKDLDGTFVVGINHHTYDPAKHHVISNASCTTNCLAPLAQVIQQNFGIVSGFMTTVHAYTSDQNILDGSHKDLRRARAAAMSMIPTTTGAAKAVGLVIPELVGKLDGFAIRVPTPNVSFVDFCCRISKKADKEAINQAIVKASGGELNGVLTYEETPLVSIDYVGMTHSSCVDLSLTNVIDDMVKTVAWYDNEVGFSHRVLDLASYVGKQACS